MPFVHFAEKCQKRSIKTAIGDDLEDAILEQLDVAFVGAGDIDRGAQNLVQQGGKMVRLDQARTDLLHASDSCQLNGEPLLALTQSAFSALAVADVPQDF